MLATAVGGGREKGGQAGLAGNTAGVAGGNGVEWQNVPHSSLTVRHGEMLRLWELLVCSLVCCMIEVVGLLREFELTSRSTSI